jgi:hypothetical protein
MKGGAAPPAGATRPPGPTTLDTLGEPAQLLAPLAAAAATTAGASGCSATKPLPGWHDAALLLLPVRRRCGCGGGAWPLPAAAGSAARCWAAELLQLPAPSAPRLGARVPEAGAAAPAGCSRCCLGRASAPASASAASAPCGAALCEAADSAGAAAASGGAGGGGPRSERYVCASSSSQVGRFEGSIASVALRARGAGRCVCVWGGVEGI